MILCLFRSWVHTLRQGDAKTCRCKKVNRDIIHIAIGFLTLRQGDVQLARAKYRSSCRIELVTRQAYRIRRQRFMTQLSSLDSTEPPGIDNLLGAVLPTWTKVGVYNNAGRLAHIDIHQDPVAPREKGGRTVKCPRRDEDSARLT